MLICTLYFTTRFNATTTYNRLAAMPEPDAATQPLLSIPVRHMVTHLKALIAKFKEIDTQNLLTEPTKLAPAADSVAKAAGVQLLEWLSV